MLFEKAFTSDAEVYPMMLMKTGSNDYYPKVIVMIIHPRVWIMVYYIGIGISLISVQAFGHLNQ